MASPSARTDMKYVSWGSIPSSGNLLVYCRLRTIACEKWNRLLYVLVFCLASHSRKRTRRCVAVLHDERPDRREHVPVCSENRHYPALSSADSLSP
jgi:hypothetical protein